MAEILGEVARERRVDLLDDDETRWRLERAAERSKARERGKREDPRGASWLSALPHSGRLTLAFPTLADTPGILMLPLGTSSLTIAAAPIYSKRNMGRCVSEGRRLSGTLQPSHKKPEIYCSIL